MTTVGADSPDMDNILFQALRIAPTRGGDVIRSYIYRPLATGTKDIRLIALLPSADSWKLPRSVSAEIVLRIHQPSSQAPNTVAPEAHTPETLAPDIDGSSDGDENTVPTTYSALSYTWGPKLPVNRVYVAEEFDTERRQ